MKKVLLVCLFTIAIFTQSKAQDNTEFKKETIEFIKLTGATSAFETAIDQIGINVSEANKLDYKKEAEGTLEDLYGELAAIYMK